MEPRIIKGKFLIRKFCLWRSSQPKSLIRKVVRKMNNFSPNESYQTTLSPNSRLSVKKRLKSRQKRTKCSFLDDEIGIQKLEGITGKILWPNQIDSGPSIPGWTFKIPLKHLSNGLSCQDSDVSSTEIDEILDGIFKVKSLMWNMLFKLIKMLNLNFANLKNYRSPSVAEPKNG